MNPYAWKNVAIPVQEALQSIISISHINSDSGVYVDQKLTEIAEILDIIIRYIESNTKNTLT